MDVDSNIHQNHQQCSGLDVYHEISETCLKLHVQYLPKYGYTRYIHSLLARTRSPKYQKKGESITCHNVSKIQSQSLWIAVVLVGRI